MKYSTTYSLALFAIKYNHIYYELSDNEATQIKNEIRDSYRSFFAATPEKVDNLLKLEDEKFSKRGNNIDDYLFSPTSTVTQKLDLLSKIEYKDLTVSELCIGYRFVAYIVDLLFEKYEKLPEEQQKKFIEYNQYGLDCYYELDNLLFNSENTRFSLNDKFNLSDEEKQEVKNYVNNWKKKNVK